MYRILVTADESRFCAELSQMSSAQDCEVDYVADTLQLCQIARTYPYDVILIDRHLSRTNAFELCKALRMQGDKALIFILNTNSAEDERVALSYGADQCVSHPVDVRELYARIRALLRRRKPVSPGMQLQCHNLTIDLETGLVTKNGEPIDLRPMEFVLLSFLMKNQGRVFSSSDLWVHVWKRKGVPSDSVRAHIAMLRKKIADNQNRALIKTIVGRGYKIEPPLN